MRKCLAKIKRTRKRCHRAGTEQGYCEYHHRVLFWCCGGNDVEEVEHCRDCPKWGTDAITERRRQR